MKIHFPHKWVKIIDMKETIRKEFQHEQWSKPLIQWCSSNVQAVTEHQEGGGGGGGVIGMYVETVEIYRSIDISWKDWRVSSSR